MALRTGRAATTKSAPGRRTSVVDELLRLLPGQIDHLVPHTAPDLRVYTAQMNSAQASLVRDYLD